VPLSGWHAMTRRLFWRGTVSLGVVCAGIAPVRAGARLRTAFMPFTLEDTSHPNPGARPDPADVARLRRVEEEVMRLLQQSGGYVAVSTKPLASAIAENDLAGCDGCAVVLAREVGAQAVVTGVVQKVSDLIISMNIAIQAVPSGRLIAAGSVDLRGDNDQSWRRGAAWLVSHRLLGHG